MPAQRSPRDLGNQDLVLSHFTLARHHPLDDRIAIAAAAGFAGVGLYLGDVQRNLDAGLTFDDLDELLTRHDVVLSDIEVLRAWAEGKHDPTEELAWRLADRFGCRYVQAIGPYAGTLDDAAEAFAGLCDRAAEHGLVVGLEHLPFTNIRHPGEALAIVEAADRANGGLCVDIWHHARTGNDPAVLAAIPGERIMGIQISDGPLAQELDDYVDDCLRRRVPPGEGDMDAALFVRTLLADGATVPWSVEACTDTVWDGPAEPWLRRCAEGVRRLLAEAQAGG